MTSVWVAWWIPRQTELHNETQEKLKEINRKLLLSQFWVLQRPRSGVPWMPC